MNAAGVVAGLQPVCGETAEPKDATDLHEGSNQISIVRNTAKKNSLPGSDVQKQIMCINVVAPLKSSIKVQGLCRK